MTDHRSDYLWDRSGEPDPEVQHLEEILGALRHRGSLPVLPGRPAQPAKSGPDRGAACACCSSDSRLRQ